jgi:hypothetical protein
MSVDPSLWSEHYDESGHAYYQNEVTGESSWNPPPGFHTSLEMHARVETIVAAKNDGSRSLEKKDRSAEKALSEKELSADKNAREKRRAEQKEAKRLRDVERARARAMEEEKEKKRLEEAERVRKIEELEAAWEQIQASLLTVKQQRILAGKGIRAVKNEHFGGVKVFLAECSIYKGGFEDENGTHFNSVNAKDYNLNSPLHVAAKLGKIHFVRQLLQAGMDPTFHNASGLNALQLAISGNHPECAILLLFDGQCEFDVKSKRLRCKSLLDSGHRCPNDQKEGGFCENKACKETGNDMLMAAMKKAKEKKEKFDIGEFNKQDDDDLGNKTPMQIAMRRRSPFIYSFLSNFELSNARNMATALRRFRDAESVHDAQLSMTQILDIIATRRMHKDRLDEEARSNNEDEIGDGEIDEHLPESMNVMYETMTCWRSLLSAAVGDPEPAVYGHQMRLAPGLATKWEELSRFTKRRFLHGQWTHTMKNLERKVYNAFGDFYGLYEVPSRTLLGAEEWSHGETMGHHEEKTESTELLGHLELIVVSATNLSKADTFGKSDPYCTLYVNGVKQGQTKTLKRTLNPVWSEQFRLELPTPPLDVDDTITFEVHDYDLIGKHDFLGEVKLNGKRLQEFIDGGVVTKPHSFSLMKKLDEFTPAKGELQVSFVSFK